MHSCMNKGFTTGSCAAAAAKAAAYMLLGGEKSDRTEIVTPSDETYRPRIENAEMGSGYAKCAVRKDSGDDPDITDGMLIYAKVSFADGPDDRVGITGGEGIGTVTRPGLDRPVGDAAINSVPRRMIEEEVRSAMDEFGYAGALDVEISAPEGKEIARMTFNPRLGIEGGISILGTTGIVEPMSTKALLDTIKVELRQKLSMGCETAVVSPGNYGADFMKNSYGYDLGSAVKCSNYIGETVDMAADMGFRKMLLCGHIGKLIKLSGGIMNTHSKEADCRMELMAAAAVKCGASSETAAKILGCVSTEEAVEIYRSELIDRECFSYIMDRIKYHLDRRSAGRMDVQVIMYSSRFGLLGTTPLAESCILAHGDGVILEER